METKKAKEKAKEIFTDVKTEVKREFEEVSETIKKNPKRTLAVIAYFIFFIPLLTKDRKEPFVWFHTKQGIGFFLFASVLRGIVTAVAGPPYTAIGSSLSTLLLPVAHIILIVLIVLGVMNAASGKMKKLPVIGKYADRMF